MKEIEIGKNATIHKGFVALVEEVALTCNKAAKEYFGEFSHLNILGED